MPVQLTHVRCFQHVSREAVARCPECQRFYCRECVTEHHGRMICRSCLEDLLAENKIERKGFLHGVVGWLLAGIGLMLAAYVFYLLGRILLRIPSSFHSGIFFD